MNILIFSGTTEGREISYRLAEMGHRVTVSVATVFGRAAQESGRTAQKETAGPVQVLQGRLEEADIRSLHRRDPPLRDSRGRKYPESG